MSDDPVNGDDRIFRKYRLEVRRKYEFQTCANSGSEVGSDFESNGDFGRMFLSRISHSCTQEMWERCGMLINYCVPDMT